MKFSEVERAMFGEHTFNRAKVTGAPFITIQQIFQAEEESNQRYAQIQRRQLVKQENVVQVIDIHRESKRSLCSKTFHIDTNYEFNENYLKKELIRRRKAKRPFTELELTRLFYDMVEGYTALQMTNNKINEINPVLVWIHDDPIMHLQRAKVIERINLSKDQRTNLINTVTAGMDVYMDPLVFSSLINNKLKAIADIDNWAKIDVFALGLVLLEAGILESVQPIYDTQKGEFRRDKLVNLMKKFFLLYGDSSLISVWLTKILEDDWKKRPDFGEIRSGLPNWFHVKAAIDIGQSELVGGKKETGTLDDISTMTYGQSNAEIAPVRISSVTPTDTNAQPGAPKLRYLNDFEIDPSEFVPVASNSPKIEKQEPKVKTETPFDFYDFTPGSNSKQHDQYNKYAQQEVKNDFPAQNFSSFKVFNTEPNVDKNSIEDTADFNRNNLNNSDSASKGLSITSPKTPTFLMYDELGNIQLGNHENKEIDQVQKYLQTGPINVFKEKEIDDYLLHNQGKSSLIGDGLLSAIRDSGVNAHDRPNLTPPNTQNANPYNSGQQYIPSVNFSDNGTNFVALNQNPHSSFARKPQNDFHSGLSGFSEFETNLNQSPNEAQGKMTLSEFLKMNKGN